MRVLHVISGIAREQGGPTFALEGLARAQKAVGLDVRVLATWQMIQGRDNAKTFHDMGVACDVYGPAHGKFSKLKGLDAIVARHVADADVVHIHAMWEEVQHVAAVEARRAGVPYVWRACNAISLPIMRKNYLLKRAVLAWRLKRDLNGAAAMHYATADERDESAWLRLRSPAIVEPNGVDVASVTNGHAGRFVERYPQLRGRRVLLFVGRLSPEKGFEVLLPAFVHAVEELDAEKDWTLVIVGSDPERPYRDVVEELALDARVQPGQLILTGHLDGTAKADAYAAADLFVLPSRSENFGNVVIEALAAGVPVVVTRGVGLSPEVHAMRVGLVAEYDEESLYLKLFELMHDAARRSKLSAAAPELIRARFDWEAIARRWAAHYASLSRPDESRSSRMPM